MAFQRFVWIQSFYLKVSLQFDTLQLTSSVAKHSLLYPSSNYSIVIALYQYNITDYTEYIDHLYQMIVISYHELYSMSINKSLKLSKF